MPVRACPFGHQALSRTTGQGAFARKLGSMLTWYGARMRTSRLSTGPCAPLLALWVALTAGAGCLEEYSSTTETSSSTETDTTGEATTGSSSTGEPEEFSYEGEHVVVLADPGLELCGGTMRHMDDFVARLSDHFGVTPPTGAERIRFTWTDDEDRLAETCGLGGIIGCTEGDHVYSLSVPHNHELVHSMAYRLAGLTRPFFAEGLANAYQGYRGGPVPAHWADETTVGLDELVKLSVPEFVGIEGAYEKAGRFTAYLIAQHGMAKYLELYAALAASPELADLDAVFQEVLSVTFTESAAAFGPPWDKSGYDPLLTECDAPEIAWDGQLLEMEEYIRCEDEHVIGPYFREDLAPTHTIAANYTIDIPVDGMYELRLAGNDGEATDFPDYLGEWLFIGVSLISCPSGVESVMETRAGGTPRLGHLSAGRHSLRILGNLDFPLNVSFTLKRMG
jgi:hypothetical protein